MRQREPKLNISEGDIRAVYRQSEDAIVRLVQSLVERVTTVETQVSEIENRLQKDSRNSSKPPSGDGFKQRTQSLRKKSERRSGGQECHPGSTLEWRESVDVIHEVNECQSCRHSLALTAAMEYDFRQVHELHSLRLRVIEHQAEIKCCPQQCASMNCGDLPADVRRNVQYGSGLKGLMVYLTRCSIAALRADL